MNENDGTIKETCSEISSKYTEISHFPQNCVDVICNNFVTKYSIIISLRYLKPIDSTCLTIYGSLWFLCGIQLFKRCIKLMVKSRQAISDRESDIALLGS